MAFEVKKQPRETSQSLIYRFSKRIRQSGVLVRARKNRFKKRPPSRQAKKSAALRREELKKQFKKLEKLGKTKNK